MNGFAYHPNYMPLDGEDEEEDNQVEENHQPEETEQVQAPVKVTVRQRNFEISRSRKLKPSRKSRRFILTPPPTTRLPPLLQLVVADRGRVLQFVWLLPRPSQEGEFPAVGRLLIPRLGAPPLRVAPLLDRLLLVECLVVLQMSPPSVPDTARRLPYR